MKLFLVSLVLLQVLSALAADNLAHFYGYKVVRANIRAESQIPFIERLGLDVWSHHSSLELGENDIMVNSTHEEILKAIGVDYTILIADVEQHLENERETLRRLASQPLASWFDTYHDYDGIVAFYQNLSTTYPTLATFTPSIGLSLQGRNLPAITLGNPAATKKIFLQGGQHAREWIAPATVAYIANELLATYETDPVSKQLLTELQFVIVPLVNPDGYVFTHTSNRLWRKNRRANTGGSFGVDLNRNWDDHWGGEGSSSNPTSDTYHGTAPFSEPESKVTSAYILATGPFALAIDYHSYSQLILRPYGWSTTLPPNDATAKLVGDGIRDQIRAVHNVQYTSEPSWQLYYTAGTAQDWFYSIGKVPLAYTIELRDTGTYGFQLPPAQIIPTGEENYAAFVYYASYVLKN